MTIHYAPGVNLRQITFSMPEYPKAVLVEDTAPVYELVEETDFGPDREMVWAFKAVGGKMITRVFDVIQ